MAFTRSMTAAATSRMTSVPAAAPTATLPPPPRAASWPSSSSLSAQSAPDGEEVFDDGTRPPRPSPRPSTSSCPAPSPSPPGSPQPPPSPSSAGATRPTPCLRVLISAVLVFVAWKLIFWPPPHAPLSPLESVHPDGDVAVDVDVNVDVDLYRLPCHHFAHLDVYLSVFLARRAADDSSYRLTLIKSLGHVTYEPARRAVSILESLASTPSMAEQWYSLLDIPVKIYQLDVFKTMEYAQWLYDVRTGDAYRLYDELVECHNSASTRTSITCLFRTAHPLFITQLNLRDWNDFVASFASSRLDRSVPAAWLTNTIHPAQAHLHRTLQEIAPILDSHPSLLTSPDVRHLLHFLRDLEIRLALFSASIHVFAAHLDALHTFVTRIDPLAREDLLAHLPAGDYFRLTDPATTELEHLAWQFNTWLPDLESDVGDMVFRTAVEVRKLAIRASQIETFGHCASEHYYSTSNFLWTWWNTAEWIPQPAEFLAPNQKDIMEWSGAGVLGFRRMSPQERSRGKEAEAEGKFYIPEEWRRRGCVPFRGKWARKLVGEERWAWCNREDCKDGGDGCDE